MSMADKSLYILQEAIKVSSQVLQAAYCRSADATKRLPVLEGFLKDRRIDPSVSRACVCKS